MTITKTILNPYLSSTGIHNLPPSWTVTDLSSVVTDVQSGFASGERDLNGVIQLRMNNISSDGKLTFEELLKVPKPPDLNEYSIKKDDILFNNTNSLDLIGKTAIAKTDLEFTFSNHITRIRVDEGKVIPYWLYLILLRYRERSVFKSICNTHVGQSGIGKNELKKLRIWLPPFPKQQKIASILSKVDDLVQKTEKIIDKTQSLQKGLMQTLLTKGIGHEQFKKIKLNFNKEEVPKDWLTVTVGELCNVNKTNHVKSELYIGLEHIGQGTNRLESKGSIKDFLSTTKTFRKGNVLYGKLRPLLNKVWLATEDGYCSTDILPLEPDMKVKGEFLLYILSSSRFLWYAVGTSAGTHMPRTNWEDIKSFQVAIPPLHEQERIISIIDRVNNRIQNLIKYRTGLETLKKGLTQKLLTGQIQVKV